MSEVTISIAGEHVGMYSEFAELNEYIGLSYYGFTSEHPKLVSAEVLYVNYETGEIETANYIENTYTIIQALHIRDLF
jgi:hypothetical protein